MIDAKTLDYDFKEEELGFEEPFKQEDIPLTVGEKASLGLVALGILAFVTQLLGSPLQGTWAGFLLAFILPSVGASLYFWLSYKDTVPGIKNNNNYYRSLLARGSLGWIAGIVMTGFYVLLYWWPQYLEGGIRMTDPLSGLLTGGPANQWFLYGLP